MTEERPVQKKTLKRRLISTAIVVGLIGGVVAFAVVPGIVEGARSDRITGYNVTEVGHPVEIVDKKGRRGLTRKYVRYEYTAGGESHSVLGGQINIGVTLRYLPDLIVYYDPADPEDAILSGEAVEGTGGVPKSNLLDDSWGPNFDEMPDSGFVLPPGN
ncbi:hypothetical protein E3T39_06125 [Cryobacterium suzukii]|uniref:DUF3592 domain-containing protein n=1 Tax=Cryobacterium suzukii TaxID=1259198 RepID=A0A4R9AH82_9MICO|nr:hypothetical protein [Cryobacterium suzukii]TFD61615.1 hypothetical protein E3T39_06125 [Cryobacterium suzukii]